MLAQATGIPVFKLTEEESSRLVFMEKALHQRVIGQEEAISALAKTIRRQRAGLKDPKRPNGSFIFAGPTGVGKTELAKALAEFLFDDEAALISLDMSEFGEKHTVSRLFGAPPGFVGFEEGGQLTEKVRRKPFSVVLFDEIEKAHPDIFNSLLQILEEGRLTDGQGRMIDFKNTVIIMTTNLGARDIAGGPVGFQVEGDTSTSYDRMQGKVKEELKRHFKPEFLNRVDDIIVFPQLSKPELVQIVDLFTKRLGERLLDRDMTIELTLAAKEKLIEIGFDPALGARPLRRAMQHEVEDRLSERILHGELNAGDHVRSTRVNGEFVFENGPRGEKVAVGVVGGRRDHRDARPRGRERRVPRIERRADAAASALRRCRGYARRARVGRRSIDGCLLRPRAGSCGRVRPCGAARSARMCAASATCSSRSCSGGSCSARTSSCSTRPCSSSSSPRTRDGSSIGCGALHVMWEDLGEVRTLIVARRLAAPRRRPCARRGPRAERSGARAAAAVLPDVRGRLLHAARIRADRRAGRRPRRVLAARAQPRRGRRRVPRPRARQAEHARQHPDAQAALSPRRPAGRMPVVRARAGSACRQPRRSLGA